MHIIYEIVDHVSFVIKCILQHRVECITTLFCRMEAHTCRLRGINIGFSNPVMYSEKIVRDNRAIDELTKGWLP
jgi:hypothetical protein